MKAADVTEFAKLIQPHYWITATQVAKQEVMLRVDDTTFLDMAVSELNAQAVVQLVMVVMG